MEKKISLILFSLLLTIGLAFGQEYTFKVLANKGQNKVKKQSGELVTLKTGALLYDQEEIISSEGAYIGLMHKTGKTTEVRGAGTKKVAELASKINTKKTSAASRYAQFIAAKMAEGEGNANRNRTNTTGAVSRAAGEGAMLDVLIPGKSINVYSDEAIVRWRPLKGTAEGTKYTVTIKNIFDDVIYTEETDKNSINLKFDEIENESGLYIFKVQQTENAEIASDDFGIKKLQVTDKPEVTQGLESLMQELTDDTPLNKLVIGSFYEENGLLLDAFTQYEQAVQSAPDVPDFRQLYDAFLINNNIVKVED